MKTTKIELTSWMNYIIQGMLGLSNLPKTLCTYLPLLLLSIILAIVFLPFTIVAFLMPNVRAHIKSNLTSKHNTHLPLTFIFTLISAIIFLFILTGAVMLEESFGYTTINLQYFLYSFALGFILWALIIIIVAVIIIIATKTSEYFEYRKYYKKSNLLSDYINDKKNKRCSKIKYIK